MLHSFFVCSYEKRRTAKDLSPSQAITDPELEDVFECQLDVARFVDRVADLTKVISRTGVVARRSQADHVEGVKEVAAEFNVTSFGDREVLRQGEVDLLVPRITF